MHLRKWDAYRVYLILSSASSLFFMLIFTLNLVYEAQVVGLMPLQLVLVGTTVETTCFLFEIPTGIVADLYSRRLSVIIGFLLIGIGFTIEGAWPFFGAVLLNQVIWGIGSTFTSGALDAWIIDEVGEERMGAVLLRGSQAGQIGGVAGVILSVILGSVALALPVVVGGLLFVVLTIFLVLVMPERNFHPTLRGERSTWQSMRHTVSESIHLIRLRPTLLTLAAVTLVLGLYSEGYDRLWQAHLIRDFTLPALGNLSPVVWFGIINIVTMLLSAVANEIVRRRLNMTRQRAMAAVLIAAHAAMVVALLILALAVNLILALAALLVMGTLRSTTSPILSTWTNQHIDSNVRATMLSSFGQLNAIGQIGGGPFVGAIGDRWGLHAALGVAGLLLSPVIWLIARGSRQAVASDAAEVAAEAQGS